MGLYFGTDGIRGEASAEVFQPPFLGRFARALAAHLAASGESASSPTIVIGRDPRRSGARIVADLISALGATGCRVVDAGVGPTPALAKAVIDLGADLGIVVTASHNPASDNGIKLFARGGIKLSDLVESAIEDLIAAESIEPIETLPPAESYDAVAAYIDFAVSLLPRDGLKGWKIALDCANGATAYTSPAVLRRLGAEVFILGDRPDGDNINADVGSEHPERLAELVKSSHAHLGLAHDGDGDRLILVDETGAVVPGDAVLGFLGQFLAQSGQLHGQTIVVTVMSNLGLDRALAAVGGTVLRTPVGDRHVFHRMLEGKFDFGGESSGHLIFRRILPTGDGLIAALQILRALQFSGESLSDLSARIRLFPSVLHNRRVREKIPLAEIPGLQSSLDQITSDLGENGRILVRYSGTEPKIRLLVEAKDGALTTHTLERLEAIVAEYLDFE